MEGGEKKGEGEKVEEVAVEEEVGVEEEEVEGGVCLAQHDQHLSQSAG